MKTTKYFIQSTKEIREQQKIIHATKYFIQATKYILLLGQV